MRRRSRLLRFAKWGGVVVCVLLIAIYVASAWWYFTGWSAGRYYRTLSIGAGTVQVRWSHDRWLGLAGGSWGFSRHRVRMIWTPAVTSGRIPRSPGMRTTIQIPLWVLCLITLIPTAFFWRLDRRRPKPGHCPCGYDLTGNVSGTCPECGKARQRV